jgi:prophage antirepressor-like protein
MQNENQLIDYDMGEYGRLRTAVNGAGETVFCCVDVSKSLGYETNPSRLFAHVPEGWKGVYPIHTPGGPQQMLCVTLEGLLAGYCRAQPRMRPVLWK